jgi:hypothetical protein
VNTVAEVPAREESLDLYSTFRDDSYSETSDDFSNESGDNRFTPVVPPLEMNFQGQGTNGTVTTGTNHSHSHLYGSPATYYSQHHHEQSPYNAHHSMTHVHYPQHHHLPAYGNGNGHGAYGATEHGHLGHHGQTYTGMYAKAEYLNGGYTALVPSTTPTPTHPPICTNYTNGLLSSETHLHPVTTSNEIPMSETHTVPTPPVISSSSYTDLNTVTSYTKLEPFSELLQSQVKGQGPRNGSYPALQQLNAREEEEEVNGNGSENGHKEIEGDGEGSSGQSEEETVTDTDNFGEIIKKSMVETVSA